MLAALQLEIYCVSVRPVDVNPCIILKKKSVVFSRRVISKTKHVGLTYLKLAVNFPEMTLLENHRKEWPATQLKFIRAA